MRPPPYRLHSARLVAILFLPLGLVAVAVLVTLPRRMNEVATNAASDRVRGVADLMAALVAPDLEFEDREQSRQALAELAVETDFRAAVLYDGRGQRFAAWPANAALSEWRAVTTTTVSNDGAALVVVTPVGAAGGTRGTLALTFGTDSLVSQLHRNTLMAGIAAIVVALVGLVFSIVTARFLTRRQAAEKALERSAESFVALSERVPVALVLHRDDRILYINPAGRSLLAVADERPMVGTLLSEALATGEELPPPINTSQVRLAPRTLALATGPLRYVESTSLQVQFGEADATALVALDVTERKQLHERLMLSDRMASLGTLTAGVAHEINNPLSVVSINVEMVRNALQQAAARGVAPDLGDVLEALTDAYDGAQRVGRIVRDMKSLSRVDTDANGPVDLIQAIQKSLQMVQGHLKHRARIVQQLAAVPRVLGNESRLVQTFVNLLINAAQALPEGQAQKNCVEVVTRLAFDGRVIATVRDTGCGIPAALRDRIFDPFYTTKPVGVGTGLGLSIVHSLIQAMNGTIKVDSTEGAGTIFEISLQPAMVSDRLDVISPPAGMPSKRRILVIDDEAAVVAAVRRLLASNHEVVGVQSAQAALEHLAAGARYDQVLCDVRMPDMSGIELAGRLAALHPELRRRLVFMTGDIGEAARSGPGGAQLDVASIAPVIEKPFSRAELLAFIEDHRDGEQDGSAAA
jgi:signal transduction histidine kinase/CheY-like chemotaxis protein